MTEGNHLNSREYVNNSERSKVKRFVENTKMAIRKALTASGIAASTMGPMATTTTSSFIPASVNTITAVAPIATTVKAISLGTAVSLLTACGGDEPDVPGPINPDNPKEKDTVAPTIEISKSEVDITGGKQISIKGNQLFIGDILVASRSDNKTKNCNVELSINGKPISSGITVSEEGTLSIKVSDEAGNSKNADIKLDITKNAPSITVNQYEINSSSSIKISIKNNQLLAGQDPIASRTDDNLESCKVSLTFEGKEIKSGDTIDDSGTLTIRIVNKNNKTSTAEIKFNIIKNAPNITVDQKEINIFGGVKINIKDNKLLFGETMIASRTDDNPESCKASLKFNGKDIKSGDTLNEAGTLTITVTNKNNKTSTAEITLTNDAIYGLENLKNASIQVDKEINLLEGITFADGVELLKVDVEIDGKRITISDPKHYTPDYPGTINIIFTVKGKNGNAAEVKVDNLTIKPLDYTSPSIESADPIKDYFSRYNNLTPKTKEFIYQHLLTSYLCMDRYKQDNLEYILMGEVPASLECENVGDDFEGRISGHADQGYENLKHLAPNSTIKACAGTRLDLEDYISQYPNKTFMVSCASDALGGNTIEDLKDNPTYDTLKRILGQENIIISCAIGNNGNNIKTLNENTPKEEKGGYSSASVNSNKNNKISVSGYDPRQNNIFGYNIDTRRPVGFGKGNIVMPFIPLIAGQKEIDLTGDTHSSYPTAAESGSLGNFLSILMHTHPGTTLEDAMTIMIDNYLREETFEYKNDEGNIVDGDKWYFFDTDKFLNNEILHKSDIDAIQLSSDDVQLPSHEGLCYTGKGIQFEYKGNRYDITDQSKLNEALKSGDIKRYWNKRAFRKYGGTNSVSFDVYVIDQSGKKIPDIELKSVSKAIH